MNQKIIKVKNKWTGAIASFTFENTENPRIVGKAVKERIKECAYKLGCDVEDLEILEHPPRVI